MFIQMFLHNVFCIMFCASSRYASMVNEVNAKVSSL